MLRQVYLSAGVLVDDPECRRDPTWGAVRPGEAALVGQPAGTSLDALGRAARQALAVDRSRYVGLGGLHRRIEAGDRGHPAQGHPALDPGRHQLPAGAAGAGRGRRGSTPRARTPWTSTAIVPGDWGVAVLEGGAFLDDFSKAFLLGWAAWQLYTDAVVLRTRRERQPARAPADLLRGGQQDAGRPRQR